MAHVGQEGVEQGSVSGGFSPGHAFSSTYTPPANTLLEEEQKLNISDSTVTGSGRGPKFDFANNELDLSHCLLTNATVIKKIFYGTIILS